MSHSFFSHYRLSLSHSSSFTTTSPVVTKLQLILMLWGPKFQHSLLSLPSGPLFPGTAGLIVRLLGCSVMWARLILFVGSRPAGLVSSRLVSFLESRILSGSRLARCRALMSHRHAADLCSLHHHVGDYPGSLASRSPSAHDSASSGSSSSVAILQPRTQWPYRPVPMPTSSGLVRLL